MGGACNCDHAGIDPPRPERVPLDASVWLCMQLGNDPSPRMNLRPETARPNVARAKVGRSGKAYFLKCMCSAKDNRQPVTQRSYRSSVSPELRYGHWEIDLPSANANRPSTKAQRKLASVSRSIREPLQELLQNPPRVPKTLAHEQVIPAARLFNRRRNPVRGRRAYQWPKTAVNDPAVLGSDNDALPEGAMPG
jgi:hypothetical protein